MGTGVGGASVLAASITNWKQNLNQFAVRFRTSLPNLLSLGLLVGFGSNDLRSKMVIVAGGTVQVSAQLVKALANDVVGAVFDGHDRLQRKTVQNLRSKPTAFIL